MQFTPLGDSAVAIEFGEVIKPAILERVRAVTAVLLGNPPAGTMDVVPAYTSVTVFYDLARIKGYAEFCNELKSRIATAKSVKLAKIRTVTIPVCYGGEYGPDLSEVAEKAKLTEQAVAALHGKPVYTVHALGFTPGFPYLGELPFKLHTPRRETPRVKVPAGSVGIGGSQTGIYPLASPGGWNLIGRTPLSLFAPGREEPALLRVGDEVKFKPITAEEFAAWK